MSQDEYAMATALGRKIALQVIDGGQKPEPPGDYLLQVFGEGGMLAARVPNYTPREGQIKLARAIDKAIRDGHHVIGEGPTGTGKSLAYSVPAVFHAVHHAKKICIVTANKNLQRQIYQKDLADLAKAVPWKFTYAIRKGVSSYLCARNFEKEEYRKLLREEPEFAEAINATAEWASETSTGDFEDSPGPPHRVWNVFSTSRDECDGRKCRYYSGCFVKAAKDRASGANVTVTNYHLFFMHMKFGDESKLLPPFDVVIFDEAHRAANIARDFFGEEVTFAAIYRCVTSLHLIEVKSLRAAAMKLRDDIMRATSTLWNNLEDRARRRDYMLTSKAPIPSEDLEALLIDANALYNDAADALDPPDKEGVPSVKSAKAASEAGSYRKLAEKCQEKSSRLTEFRTLAGEGMVYFLEGSAQEGKSKYLKLKSKAIEVGGFMRRMLFERYQTVVQTSATLAVRGGVGGDFGYLRREMGMGKPGDENGLPVAELVVDSPFDWPKQAMLVIPRSMPQFEMGNDRWDRAVVDHVEQVVNAMRGRTLGLFTSYRVMQLCRDQLRKNTKWRVLVQGEATNRELAAEFQRDVHSVLLGTESFSEGISIEGEACSCVVLDKIPFINKDDPVIVGIEQRLKRRGSKADVFQTHMLPEAIISFKQRVGRLIRTVKDLGLVVVLDKRLLTKPYRSQFLKSIPPLRKEDSLEAIEPFLREKGLI